MKQSSLCSLVTFKQRMFLSAVNRFRGVETGWGGGGGCLDEPSLQPSGSHPPGKSNGSIFPLSCFVGKSISRDSYGDSRSGIAAPRSTVFCPFRGHPLAFKALFSNAETAKRQMLTGVFLTQALALDKIVSLQRWWNRITNACLKMKKNVITIPSYLAIYWNFSFWVHYWFIFQLKANKLKMHEPMARRSLSVKNGRSKINIKEETLSDRR